MPDGTTEVHERDALGVSWGTCKAASKQIAPYTWLRVGIDKIDPPRLESMQKQETDK